MEQFESVHPRMTVRQVLTRFPWLEEVFNKHGLHGCGGPNGPEEPIGVFALVHRVNANALVQEINEKLAARQQNVKPTTQLITTVPVPSAQPAATTRFGLPIYKPFLLTALVVALTLGFTTGAGLLLAPLLGLASGNWWLTHAQGHGMAQLFGWAGLFTMGVALHVVPRFRNASLAVRSVAMPVLVLVGTAVLLRSLGQTLAHTVLGPPLLVAAGLALLGGAAGFALAIALTLRRGDKSHEAFEPWVLAGAAWSVIAASLHLALVGRMAVDRLVFAPPALNDAFLNAALFGFLLNFILGISTRVLPALMHLGAPKKSLIITAVLFFNLGLAWQVAARLAWSASPMWAWGSALQVAGMGLAVVAIGVFRRRQSSPTFGPGAYRRYELFVRTAYVWVLVAAVLGLYVAVSALAGYPSFLPSIGDSPVRHVLTLGFISMMIMGLGGRIIPVFEGARLQVTQFIDAAYVLLNLSVVTRLVFSVVRAEISPAMLGMSGVAGLLAVVLFTIVLWRTMRPAAKEDYRQKVHLFVGERLAASPKPPSSIQAIEAESIVGEVLERWPKTLEVFLKHGFTPLQNPRMRSTVARATTVGQACGMLGVDVQKLLSELNQTIITPSVATLDQRRQS